MSQLANALRKWAEVQTGFAGQFPGGIFPDKAPRGTTQGRLTYGVTRGVSRNPIAGLSGGPLARSERVQVEITGATRAAAETSRNWLADLIGQSPSMVTAGGLLVRQWRVEDDGTEGDEDRDDGSDENLRTVTLDIVAQF